MRDWVEQLPTGQISTAVVVEDEPSHCGFSEAELLGTWESLRSWITGGPQPDATARQTACEQAIVSGQAQGPCRIDPDYIIPTTAQRHYQRPPAYDIGPEVSGSWFNAGGAGEGFLIQVLENGRDIIYWFTYDDLGNQVWMQGAGSIAGHTMTFDNVIMTSGASFGADFDPNEVQVKRFGSITMTLSDDCLRASLEWITEDPRFQTASNRHELVRLSTPAGAQCQL